MNYIILVLYHHYGVPDVVRIYSEALVLCDEKEDF